MSETDEFVKTWHKRQFKKNLSSHISDSDSNRGAAAKTLDNNRDTINDSFVSLDPHQLQAEKKHLQTRRTARTVLKHSGTFIFILSLAATVIILFPFFGIGTKRAVQHSTNEPTFVPKLETSEAKVIKEATGLGLDARFSIYVPKIDAKSPVIENVDLGNEEQYLTALKKGVAHGKGTYFPGQGKNVFLFSHSVSAPEYVQTYNAVFYNLRNLEVGDEIAIYFSGEKYLYIVSEKFVAAPSDISFLTKDYGKETLILQTCDPPGTTLRRLLVIAKIQ